MLKDVFLYVLPNCIISTLNHTSHEPFKYSLHCDLYQGQSSATKVECVNCHLSMEMGEMRDHEANCGGGGSSASTAPHFPENGIKNAILFNFHSIVISNIFIRMDYG